jgi:membrane carboxypeptidase/penicillin-binding protein
MKGALAGMRPKYFKVPDAHVVFVDVDRKTGQLPGPETSRGMSEAFIAGTEPHDDGSSY